MVALDAYLNKCQSWELTRVRKPVAISYIPKIGTNTTVHSGPVTFQIAVPDE